MVAIRCLTLALALCVSLASTLSAQETAAIRGGAGAAVKIDSAARVQPVDEIARYELLIDGVYGRRVFGAGDADGEYTVEKWGLLVSPGAETEPYTFAGAAVLMVRSGRCTLVGVGEEEQELSLGSTLLVPEGEEIRFVNRDERPASLQATVIRGNL